MWAVAVAPAVVVVVVVVVAPAADDDAAAAVAIGIVMYYHHKTISLGVRWAPTSSLWPVGPVLGPLGLLDFILRALRPFNDVLKPEGQGTKDEVQQART